MEVGGEECGDGWEGAWVVGSVGEEEGAEVGGWGEVWGVGFEEDAVERDGLEGETGWGFARVEEVGGEGEAGAAGDEERDEGRGAGEGVEEEATRGHGVAEEELAERFPCADAVDGDGAVEF